jgi:hypothetical protein
MLLHNRNLLIPFYFFLSSLISLDVAKGLVELRMEREVGYAGVQSLFEARTLVSRVEMYSCTYKKKSNISVDGRLVQIRSTSTFPVSLSSSPPFPLPIYRLVRCEGKILLHVLHLLPFLSASSSWPGTRQEQFKLLF